MMEWKEFDGTNFPPYGTWCVCLDANGQMVVRQVISIKPNNTMWKNLYEKATPGTPGSMPAFIRDDRGYFSDTTKRVSHFYELPQPPVPNIGTGTSALVCRLNEEIAGLKQRIAELEKGEE